MTNGIQVRAEAPGTANSDLGFWLQSQVLGQPMAMTERHLTHLVESITANRFVLPRNRQTGARITEKGTAIVEVHGILINRSPVIGSFWGLTAYEGLTEQFRRLATNDDVKRIVLDVDSPGGLVAGIRGCSEALEKLAEAKPVFAIAHDMACSAGYWLACIAQEFSVTPDGEVGSIGVRGGHVSYAEMLERAGIQVRNFSVGAAKLDGAYTQLMSDGEAAEYQYDLERSYDRFVAHVAKHRPALSDNEIRKTDARTWCGSDAVDGKLCDRVETLEEMVDRVERTAAKVKPKRKAAIEPGSKGGVAPAPERNPTPASPDPEAPNAGTPRQTRGARLMSEQSNATGHETLVAAITEALGKSAKTNAPAAAAAEPAAAAPAAADDSARIWAIMESDEAKDRPALAKALAKGGLSADAAKGILAASPVETAAKPAEANGEKKGLGDALSREMSKPGNAAGVKPDAAAASAARPSLADRFAKKFEKPAKK